MKKYYVFLAALMVSFSLHAQIIDIPDANFKNALVNTNCVDTDDDGFGDSDADTNNDGEISIVEAGAVINLLLESQSISSIEGINEFSNVQSLSVRNNNLTSLDLSGLSSLIELNCGSNDFTSLDLSTLSNLTTLNCIFNQLTILDVSALSNLTTLSCGYNQLTSLNVSGLENLLFLSCPSNEFTSLDISSLSNLEGLNCDRNQITELGVNPLTNLNSLTCRGNQITQLDISTLSNLEWLDCGENQLSTLDVSNKPNLVYIGCYSNQLTELTLGNSDNLFQIECFSNQLTSIDISGYPYLIDLYCAQNQLTSLDLSNQLIPTEIIWANNNMLTTLFLKNGFIDGESITELNEPGILYLNNNPNLTYICADEAEYDRVQLSLEAANVTSYTLNSYCSFVPGGEFYTIEGAVKFDENSNGCDISDPIAPQINFSVTNGTESGSFISNASGDYFIPVQEGSHTITPYFENPDYFTISPTSISVDFPTDPSPFIQDFCVTTSGTYHDLEITITPLELARPGFDTNYKVLYKNKGTTTLSGDINFGFEDDVMGFVTATPANESGLPDLLQWSFTDLEPFESREIDLVMNLNAPTDSPPLNDGDILTFNTSITSSETDETPEDNSFVLNQTVFNSFDPNDKTCLEGDFITPEMVGEYVHYMIRFENTGSANAINIVVKDDIDITKYDLSTLVPLHASHDYVARIKDQGSDHYVEFIFEGIDLPFDDANNDGYIAFKIKTLDTLELNDSFENNAAIYFDYNFPIITNDATTTIATLSTDDFDAANNSISLYPNPTTNVLHLEAKQAIKHVYMYDISGRLIKDIAVIGSKNNLDISTQDLTSGTYFVKIKTDIGETVKKVIKK